MSSMQEGPSQRHCRGVHSGTLPPEAAGQCDGGSGKGPDHGCLHHLLQGLGIGPLDQGAEIPVVPQSCRGQALLTSQAGSPHRLPHPFKHDTSILREVWIHTQLREITGPLCPLPSGPLPRTICVTLGC